jgi:hypothetical protein
MNTTVTADHPIRDSVDADARDMDLAALVDRFRANTSAYLAGRQSDNRFGMELFRRAVMEGDQGAWSAIHDAYQPLVVGWVTRHPSLPRCGEDSRYLVNRTFERFWRAVRPERLANFPNLPSLVKYLKMCANCAVVDAARSYRPADARPLDGIDVPTEGRGNLEQTEALLRAEQLWSTVVAVIRNPLQERLAWDTLVLGMTPREVLAAYPGQWRSIAEIYEAKAAMLGRLRKSPAVLSFRQEAQQYPAMPMS